MGYDERNQSSSSGVLVAVVVVLIVALLGILAVLGAGYFFARTARVEAMVARERTVAELRRVGEEAHRADAEAQREDEEARVQVTPDPRLDFVLKLDHEGNISVNDETISLDELKTRLVEVKDESSNEFLLRIIADSDCPKRHIKSVVAVFEDVGGITWNIVSPDNADAPRGELNNVPN